MAVRLYLIKVSQTLHQSFSFGLSGFLWLCLLPFNVKWHTEDMSISSLSFLRSGPWIKETRDYGVRGESDGRQMGFTYHYHMPHTCFPLPALCLHIWKQISCVLHDLSLTYFLSLSSGMPFGIQSFCICRADFETS